MLKLLSNFDLNPILAQLREDKLLGGLAWHIEQMLMSVEEYFKSTIGLHIKDQAATDEYTKTIANRLLTFVVEKERFRADEIKNYVAPK